MSFTRRWVVRLNFLLWEWGWNGVGDGSGHGELGAEIPLCYGQVAARLDLRPEREHDPWDLPRPVEGGSSDAPGYHRAGGNPPENSPPTARGGKPRAFHVQAHAPHEINIPCNGLHKSSSSHTGSRPVAPLEDFPPHRPGPSVQRSLLHLFVGSDARFWG